VSTGGFAEEPGDLFPDLPPKPVPPDHVNVIRAALRDAAANAYPDAHAKQYEDTLVALAAGEVVVVSREDLALAVGFAYHTGGKPRSVKEAVSRLLDSLGRAK
jgi:hypothetical protein